MKANRKDWMKKNNIYTTQIMRKTGLSRRTVDSWEFGIRISDRATEWIEEAVVELMREMLDKRKHLFANPPNGVVQ